MHNCQSIDPLVTPLVDGQLAAADVQAVEAHLRVCAPCHSRVTAERAVHDLMRARRSTLCKSEAPDVLHACCSRLAFAEPRTENQEPGTKNQNREPRTSNPPPALARILASFGGPVRSAAGAKAGEPRTQTWSARVVPAALAASLVVVVGGAFVYQATDKSARVLAAELVADHAKCFAMNSAFGTHQWAGAVEQSIASSFGWRMHLPENPSPAGLELVA